MLNRFFSFVFLFFNIQVWNAQNLVPNPSFEEFENGCPADYNEMPVGWSWWRESPNSFSTCVEPENLVDSLGWAPWTGMGWQQPFDGNSFVGLSAFSPNPKPGFPPEFREYLGCTLMTPLEVDETYFVSFRTSMGWGNYFGCYWAVDKLGAIFTVEGDYQWQDNPFPVPNFAHVFNSEIITDTINWVTVEGSFVADQPYAYMALGVFFEFDSLQTESFKPGNNSLGSYYFLDQVSVSKDTTGSIRKNTHVMVNTLPNPANESVLISCDIIIQSIRVFNIYGECILTQYSKDKNTIINTHNILPGTYLIQIEFDDFTQREKLVIVH